MEISAGDKQIRQQIPAEKQQKNFEKFSPSTFTEQIPNAGYLQRCESIQNLQQFSI